MTTAVAAAAAAAAATSVATEDTPLLLVSSGTDDDDSYGYHEKKKKTTDISKDVTPRFSFLLGGATDAAIQQQQQQQQQQQPVDGLSPLAKGGVIVTTDGYKTVARPASVVKSLPAFVPYRRKARHRSYYLWWINEFRHWWKSSRLLVRLAGLFTLAFTGLFLQRMINIRIDFSDMMAFGSKKKKLAKKMTKNTKRAVKIVKRLGQGGTMRFFLGYVKPFTRTLRLVVGCWRWMKASQCRRGEVGTEEAFAFMGNRVSRMMSRLAVDSFVAYGVMPLAYWIATVLHEADSEEEDYWWHPITLFIILGCIRAVAPFAASFQGSRIGRVLTRQFFRNAKHRWLPIQSVATLNLTSDDCCELDEISQTADLVLIAKNVAKAFGRAKDIGVDGMQHQKDILRQHGFHQVGAGSGGYAVYVCHHPLPDGADKSKEVMTILLHVTPYGPSILNVMPRYVVLELEDSVDRRNQWSEYMAQKRYEGPPVVEGYCYGGAFFSPHHFAELKQRYDKQLITYEHSCKALCKPRHGRNPNPPLDLKSLKLFLANGKKPKTQRRNQRQYQELQNQIHRVAQELKKMISTPPTSSSSSSATTSATTPRPLKGVILYFEGLDCAGKSSTGGLVEQVLIEAGFQVNTKQYNRPPTPEQQLQQWMDRFDIPRIDDTSSATTTSTTIVSLAVPNGSSDDPATQPIMEAIMPRNALVWDRGPAGDFVYNPQYRAMTLEERQKRYQEFMDFDRHCYDEGILFLKLLFVTNRDSIASTLGKRLAQKQMAHDLRIWHKASRGGEPNDDNDDHNDSSNCFEGLDAIENHLDPTDFVAFNSYQTNLRIFTNFALNTDTPENPWIVVNTGDRYAARKALLRTFQNKLNRFKEKTTIYCSGSGSGSGSGNATTTPTPTTPTASASSTDPTTSTTTYAAISEEEMMGKGFQRAPPTGLIVSLMGLLIILFYYSSHTTFRSPSDIFKDTWINIEDLLPAEDDEQDTT